MKKTLFEKYGDAPAIGYYCMNNFGGLEIVGVEHDIDDYLVGGLNFGEGRTKVKRYKVYNDFNTGDCYIRVAGSRVLLSEIMRI